MTSPAVLVLILAHALTIINTASEKTTDHDNNMTNPVMYRHDNHFLWTKLDNYHVNNYKNDRSSIESSDKNKVYNKNDDLHVKVSKNDDLYVKNDKYVYLHVLSYKNNNLFIKDDKNNNSRVKNDDLQINDKDLYVKNDLLISNLEIHRRNVRSMEAARKLRNFDVTEVAPKTRMRRGTGDRCDGFIYNEMDNSYITHPHAKNSSTYYNNTDCVTVINATDGHVIELTFVDVFRIEYHPECAYDYLEIRDGLKGYSKLLDRVCGQAFPRQFTSSGPHMWLKFHSDDTIEYEGFRINVRFKQAPSQSIPESCYMTVGGRAGFINTTKTSLDPACKSGSQTLDVLWTIQVQEGFKIYLNFTAYDLAKPNECEENVIEVFGSVLEVSSRLAQYCGSMANPVSTKDENGHIMYVRLFASKSAKEITKFSATYTAYRTVNPSIDEKCGEEEFDCDDNTCIAQELVCDSIAHCRLKTDENSETCKKTAESTIKQPHIMVILIIFSLILSIMSFVFLFKCIRKLYQDHKIIKEHIRQSCEDRLDDLDERLTLDARRLKRDSEPRASLERENHANEMFKKERDSFSKRKQTSLDSEFVHETHLDLDEEPWRRDVDIPISPEDTRHRARRSDTSKKEEIIRSKRERERDRERESEERKMRDVREVSVGAPDTKESGCQTRESLFQTEPPHSSDGSGTNSRGFSTFGYSGATIARPSPPAPPSNTSEITIELLRQVPRQDSVKPQKKIPDRRPISTETTRSAPDVIIVSKPIR